jgi:hypothetical protein
MSRLAVPVFHAVALLATVGLAFFRQLCLPLLACCAPQFAAGKWESIHPAYQTSRRAAYSCTAALVQDAVLARYVAEAAAPQLPDVNHRDHQDCTPLHVALLHGAALSC